MTAARCPICRRPASPEFRPFCSKRCRELDLARWFTGAYRIPDTETPLPGDDEGETARHDSDDFTVR